MMDRRPDAKRPDPWADFLRRTLLTMGLAGMAAVPPAKASDPPAAEHGERDAAAERALSAPPD